MKEEEKARLNGLSDAYGTLVLDAKGRVKGWKGGVTKREWLAAQAPAGDIMAMIPYAGLDVICNARYAWADAMLRRGQK